MDEPMHVHTHTISQIINVWCAPPSHCLCSGIQSTKNGSEVHLTFGVTEDSFNINFLGGVLVEK